MDDITWITILLDRSGSMQKIQKATENGINEFLENHRKTDNETTVSLMQFDNKYEVVYLDHDVLTIPDVKLIPRGGTFLYNAIMRAIRDTKKGIAQRDEKPTVVLFVIVTDGKDTTGNSYQRIKTVRKMIEEQSGEGWEFIFLGANQDAVLTGSNLGIKENQSLTYGATGQHVESAFRTISERTVKYCAAMHQESYTFEDTEQFRTARTRALNELAFTDNDRKSVI